MLFSRRTVFGNPKVGRGGKIHREIREEAIRREIDDPMTRAMTETMTRMTEIEIRIEVE
jgi:hypothetical protein